MAAAAKSHGGDRTSRWSVWMDGIDCLSRPSGFCPLICLKLRVTSALKAGVIVVGGGGGGREEHPILKLAAFIKGIVIPLSEKMGQVLEKVQHTQNWKTSKTNNISTASKVQNFPTANSITPKIKRMLPHFQK
ncbi:hypothetical protein HPP92_010368 [Vanilla planifolia]|uniref:Uncharacterized protein n=1 Tax=Vanilla planifolia TaxID=51239 RepID=A0A835QTR5_VANPL|nr:hypothetical protein HPP92_010368 [Vanilla planifolia]